MENPAEACGLGEIAAAATSVPPEAVPLPTKAPSWRSRWRADLTFFGLLHGELRTNIPDCSSTQKLRVSLRTKDHIARHAATTRFRTPEAVQQVNSPRA